MPNHNYSPPNPPPGSSYHHPSQPYQAVYPAYDQPSSSSSVWLFVALAFVLGLATGGVLMFMFLKPTPSNTQQSAYSIDSYTGVVPDANAAYSLTGEVAADNAVADYAADYAASSGYLPVDAPYSNPNSSVPPPGGVMGQPNNGYPPTGGYPSGGNPSMSQMPPNVNGGYPPPPPPSGTGNPNDPANKRPPCPRKQQQMQQQQMQQQQMSSRRRGLPIVQVDYSNPGGI